MDDKASVSSPRATPRTEPPTPVITVALIAINLIVFIVAVLLGADALNPTSGELMGLGANFAPDTFRDEPWRLVTSMFLHAGILHLAMNLVGLWFTGPAAESMYGRAGFISLYAISGLAGALLSAARHDYTPSVGASGALFGVIGAIAAFLVSHRARIKPEVFERQIRSIGTVLVLNLVLGLSAKGIDMSAHVGGLVAGFVVGLAVQWGRAPGTRSMGRIAAATVAGLAACAVALVVLPAPPPLMPEPLRLRYNEMIDVDGRTHDVSEAVVADSKAGKLTDAAAADQLEREVAPPWRVLQLKTHALLFPAPAYWRPLEEAMVEYVDARVAYWTALIDGLRGGDADAVKQLDQRVESALVRLVAEQPKLK